MTSHKLSKMIKPSISHKIVFAIVALVTASLIINAMWITQMQHDAMMRSLQGKGSILTLQMKAEWDFIEVNQELINTTSGNLYEFKGLHCAIVGKSISSIFSANNDLVVTHYTNIETRNPIDMPDSFEEEALEAFLDDPQRTEYYGVTDYEGRESFRYLSVLNATESCLECHGDPIGEIDITGHEKEGWQLGDMAGAVSMVFNIDEDMAAFEQQKNQSIGFGILYTFLTCVIIYLIISGLVLKPLNALRRGVHSLSSGKFDTNVNESHFQNEFLELASDFNTMSKELSTVYENLENQVEDRTEQLRIINGELEVERERLAKANVYLKETVDLKTDFLNMMSHELRTPLTSILVFTDILLSGAETLEEKSVIMEIQASSKDLLATINNTLEVARFEAGKAVLNRGIVDIGELVSVVEGVVLPLAEKKNICFMTDIDPRIPLLWVDWEKLRHAIENLCSNAIKFTSEGGDVSLFIYMDEERADNLIIQVSDTGIGIEEKSRVTIFEKFVQSDSSAKRRFSGTGLGLSLAKQMVELHGGAISVESDIGRGSTFTISIPIVRKDNQNENTDS